MEVTSSCPKCGCQYGWDTNQLERTPDGGTCPARSPNCPKCGYDVTGTNERAQKNLHWFAKRGNTDGMQRLLRPGLANLFGMLSRSVDERNAGGLTPLMIAAMYAQKEAVLFLLDNGADPNAKDKGGDTALDIAKEYTHPQIAEVLKARGAVA
ncbi:MAG: ankyrin repeat domain-containing protein [Planctomycetota bacterium]|nr:ankyrin repeat domain-containing protein [Planctomycetota bacterium]